MFSQKVIVSVTCCASLFFFATSVAASFRADTGYTLIVESHSEEPDREISGLNLDIKSDYYSENFTMLLDIENDAWVEHGGGDDNVSHVGFLQSRYQFIPSTSWVFNMQALEINSESDQNLDLDILATETVVSVTTGAAYRYSTGMRGAIVAELLTSNYYYDDSPLDAIQDTFSIAYEYPIRELLSLNTSLRIERQRYRESVESVNDAQTNSIRIELVKQVGGSEYQVFLEPADVEFLNQDQEEQIESYGVLATYEINSRSNLIFEYSNTLEQVFSYNQTLVSPVIPVLTSGLLEIESVSLQYRYQVDRQRMSIELFENDIRNVSDFGVTSGKQKGVEVSYSRHLNDKTRLDVTLEAFNEEIVDSDSKTFVLGVNYQLYETRRINSVVNFIIEEREENNENDDDILLEWVTEVGFN